MNKCFILTLKNKKLLIKNTYVNAKIVFNAQGNIFSLSLSLFCTSSIKMVNESDNMKITKQDVNSN